MTQEQFAVINRRLDVMLDDQRGLVADTRRLRESIERLPTLRDIYVESLRLLALTFGPIWAVLLVAVLLTR
jgi:hypothetical protein